MQADFVDLTLSRALILMAGFFSFLLIRELDAYLPLVLICIG
ncbi:hypothetical protein [Xenorhabdus littoralis]|nr:hypothetical protein [Xenorhabdus sp. psl]